MVCALDTELLGHWWYEGPAWLEAVVEEAEAAGLALGTISEALGGTIRARRRARRVELGVGKGLPHLGLPGGSPSSRGPRAGSRASSSGTGHRQRRRGGGAARLPVGGRRAAELLALQSSDWAFMVTRGLAGDYPRRAAARGLRRGRCRPRRAT